MADWPFLHSPRDRTGADEPSGASAPERTGGTAARAPDDARVSAERPPAALPAELPRSAAATRPPSPQKPRRAASDGDAARHSEGRRSAPDPPPPPACADAPRTRRPDICGANTPPRLVAHEGARRSAAPTPQRPRTPSGPRTAPGSDGARRLALLPRDGTARAGHTARRQRLARHVAAAPVPEASAPPPATAEPTAPPQNGRAGERHPFQSRLSGREACLVFGLRATTRLRGAQQRPDPRLAAELAGATGDDCLAAVFSLRDDATPADLVARTATRASPPDPPFEDEPYYRAIARWLGCGFADASALLSLRRRAPPGAALTFHPSVEEGGMLIRMVVDGRQLMVVSPAPSWLPGLAALVCREPSAVQRVIIAAPQTLHRIGAAHGGGLEVRGRIVPLHAIAPDADASRVLTTTQRASFAAALILLSVAAAMVPDLMLPATIALVTAILVGYAASRGAAILAELSYPPRRALRSAELPHYSVLVPLYREDVGVGPLVRAMARLDYPRDKLDLMFLAEEDDAQTRAALARETKDLPCRIVVVPKGQPRTKPRALNAALRQARGEYVTIFDAEDRPHPRQLRIAAETFAAAPARLAALQARLTIDHMSDNWLTAMFAIEYACLFDRIMPMIAGRDRLVLLGGTSNHFRRDALIACGGWDPYNVTEDADLAVRLRRRGHAIAMIDSWTEEEAPVSVSAWLKQRSRWFKGFMQTWLVHNRQPLTLMREIGWRDTALFHLFIVGAIIAALTHVIFSLQLVAALVGLYQPFSGPNVWLSAFQLAAVTFGYGANFALGALSLQSTNQRRHRLSPWLVLWFPLYWILMGIAVLIALHDIVRKPHHWRKTTHGVAQRPSRRRRRPAPSAPS